jgi:dihydroorotate dehydrogenase
MITSRFIKVHPDALLEYIWDDDFNYANDYSVVKDVLNNESSFVFGSNITDTENYNKLPNQLYLIDGLINRYGIMNPETKTFLQESKFVNNQASRFDKVKI